MIRELAKKLAALTEFVDCVMIELKFRRGNFKASTEILKKHAFVGRQLELIDNIVTQYRFIRYKDYFIFYRVDDKKVYIDRILRSRQDYVNEFAKEL